MEPKQVLAPVLIPTGKRPTWFSVAGCAASLPCLCFLISKLWLFLGSCLRNKRNLCHQIFLGLFPWEVKCSTYTMNIAVSIINTCQDHSHSLAKLLKQRGKQLGPYSLGFCTLSSLPCAKNILGLGAPPSTCRKAPGRTPGSANLWRYSMTMLLEKPFLQPCCKRAPGMALLGLVPWLGSH